MYDTLLDKVYNLIDTDYCADCGASLEFDTTRGNLCDMCLENEAEFDEDFDKAFETEFDW